MRDPPVDWLEIAQAFFTMRIRAGEPPTPRRADLRWGSFLLASLLVVTTAHFTVHLGTRNAPIPPEGQPMMSLVLAINHALCGRRSTRYLQPAGKQDLSEILEDNREILDLPLLSVPGRAAGSTAAYCGGVPLGFVNNENSLMYYYMAVFALWPEITENQLAAVLSYTHLLGVWTFAAALVALGASPFVAFLAFVIAVYAVIRVEAATHLTSHLYATYAFFSPLLLSYCALLALLAQKGARRSLLVCVGIGLAVGGYGGFIFHMRTSLVPEVLWGQAVLAVAWLWPSQRGGEITQKGGRWRTAALVAGCTAGAVLFQHLLIAPIARLAPGYNSTQHNISHNLVLGLAVPPSPLAAAEGIRWLDAAGLTIAQRQDPTVHYLTPRYEAVLLEYYKNLWKTRPQEMLATYWRKWQTAGARSDFVISLLVPNGVVLSVLYAAGLGYVVWRRRAFRPGVWVLGATLLGMYLLTLAEAAVIYSSFSKAYHQLLFFVNMLTVAGGLQWLVGRRLGGNRETPG
jgi:hypothetical protein